jgi:hypothetical protein
VVPAIAIPAISSISIAVMPSIPCGCAADGFQQMSRRQRCYICIFKHAVYTRRQPTTTAGGTTAAVGTHRHVVDTQNT